MCDLDDIKEKIRAAMESQGTYTEDLELCITLCAGSYMAFQIALNDISKKRMKSYVKEVSRENNDKLTAHPAFKVLFDALEATRKQLRELGLTFQTLSASDSSSPFFFKHLFGTSVCFILSQGTYVCNTCFVFCTKKLRSLSLSKSGAASYVTVPYKINTSATSFR